MFTLSVCLSVCLSVDNFLFRAITFLPCLRSSRYFTCTLISIWRRRLSKVTFSAKGEGHPFYKWIGFCTFLPFPCDNSTTVHPIFTILHMYIHINHGNTPIESDLCRPKVKVTTSIDCFSPILSPELCPFFHRCIRSCGPFSTGGILFYKQFSCSLLSCIVRELFSHFRLPNKTSSLISMKFELEVKGNHCFELHGPSGNI